MKGYYYFWFTKNIINLICYLITRNRHLKKRPGRPNRFQVCRRSELRPDPNVSSREERTETDRIRVAGARVRSVQRRRQDVKHLVRPEHQHLLDGSQTHLSNFRRRERVAKSQQPARHVGHILPAGQDCRDLAAVSLQSNCFD